MSNTCVFAQIKVLSVPVCTGNDFIYAFMCHSSVLCCVDMFQIFYIMYVKMYPPSVLPAWAERRRGGDNVLLITHNCVCVCVCPSILQIHVYILRVTANWRKKIHPIRSSIIAFFCLFVCFQAKFCWTLSPVNTKFCHLAHSAIQKQEKKTLV